MRTRAFVVAGMMTALLATSACGGHKGSSSSASDAENRAKAVASSSANVAVENQVQTEVTNCVNGTPTAKLLTKDGRQQVITCLKGLVPADKQDAFKQCVATAAANDKVWTADGRSKFENEGVAACVTQVTGTAAPSASATPSASASK
jgi:hypothetical protein